MIGITAENREIFRAVVEGLAVQMVNDFLRVEIAAKQLLRNQPMFRDIALLRRVRMIGSPDIAVALHDPNAALPAGMTGSSARAGSLRPEFQLSAAPPYRIPATPQAIRDLLMGQRLYLDPIPQEGFVDFCPAHCSKPTEGASRLL